MKINMNRIQYSLIICIIILLLSIPFAFGETTIKVGVYGGYFKDSFDKHIFPDFTKATGIKVESVAEPTGEAWLQQLDQAARAGQAPADVSMMALGTMLRGQKRNLWAELVITLFMIVAGVTSKRFPIINFCSPISFTGIRTAGWTASVPFPGTSPWYPIPKLFRMHRNPGPTCGSRIRKTNWACWLWQPTPTCWRSPRQRFSGALKYSIPRTV